MQTVVSFLLRTWQYQQTPFNKDTDDSGTAYVTEREAGALTVMVMNLVLPIGDPGEVRAEA